MGAFRAAHKAGGGAGGRRLAILRNPGLHCARAVALSPFRAGICAARLFQSPKVSGKPWRAKRVTSFSRNKLGSMGWLLQREWVAPLLVLGLSVLLLLRF